MLGISAASVTDVRGFSVFAPGAGVDQGKTVKGLVREQHRRAAAPGDRNKNLIMRESQPENHR